jgi:molybdopterin molybdotransferase
MITLEEAQQRLFALANTVEAERVPLVEAIGRWAAEPVTALRTQPARDLSAMDGYAIRFGDLPGPLRIIGESAAGGPFGGALRAGEAVRIFTGAVVPEGADTVILQEDVSATDGAMTMTGDGPSKQGAHIRAEGSDFRQDDVLINPGDALLPARIGLAAMGGYADIAVHRKLRVALVSTGDELVPPGAQTSAFQIPSSNAVMLAALLHSLPVVVDDRGIVRDQRDALEAEFNALSHCDIVVTLGGASVGDHDLVRPALETMGASLDFWKVAMRPGKPVMAGRLGHAIVLGLPGNPVSAYVTAILFLLPLVAHMSGSKAPLPKRSQARLGSPLPANGPRIDHVRARLDGGTVTPTGKNDSAMLAALASAQALIVREPGANAAQSGDIVEIIATI